MLHFMRKHAKFFYIFFFLIIISFIFFYVGPVDNNGAQPLAEIEGERISVEEFWRAYDNTVQAYRETYKEKFDAAMEKKLNLKQTVLYELVQAKLLYVAARDMGLEVTDAELRDAIMSQPVFQRDGKFSRDLYLRTLQRNRMTPRYFEQKMREDLLVSKLRNMIESSIETDYGDSIKIEGNQQFADQLRKVLVRQERQKAVDAFVEALKKRYRVIMRAQLIA